MKPHTDIHGNTLTERDHVLIDNKWAATVLTAGADRSLLSHARSDGESGEEHDWYDNDRLSQFTAEMQATLRQQQELNALQRSDDEAQRHWQEQFDASYR